MEKIDAAGAFALLERVVAERGGDYVYGRSASGDCKYLHGRYGVEAPGCAVGLAATYAGVPVVTLRRWDRSVNSQIGTVGQDAFTSSALDVLRSFQIDQDSGIPYGVALDTARKVLDTQTAA